jgi:hypothetical protein
MIPDLDFLANIRGRTFLERRATGRQFTVIMSFISSSLESINAWY